MLVRPVNLACVAMKAGRNILTQRTLGRGIFSFVCLLLSLSGASQAGSFNVNPVRVELSAKERSAVLRVENNGDAAVTIQLQSMAWSQELGKDKLAATRDVIATPSIFKLKAGATQIVRVGMLRNADPQRELSYRLFLEEIPTPPAPDFKGLQVALRIGIPIFIQPVETAVSQLKFLPKRLADGQMQLTLVNQGLAHSQIFGLKVFPAAKPDAVFAASMISLYVLPGQERSLLMRPGDFSQAADGQLLIKAQTRSGPVESHATLVGPD